MKAGVVLTVFKDAKRIIPTLSNKKREVSTAPKIITNERMVFCFGSSPRFLLMYPSAKSEAKYKLHIAIAKIK